MHHKNLYYAPLQLTVTTRLAWHLEGGWTLSQAWMVVSLPEQVTFARTGVADDELRP